MKDQSDRKRGDQKARDLHQRVDMDAIAATIVINILTLAMPLGMMLVFDRVVPNKSHDTLAVLFFALIAVVGIDLILKVARAHLTMSRAREFGHDVGEVISHRLFNAKIGALERLEREALIDRVVGILGLRHTTKGQIVRTMIDLTFSVAFIGVIWALGGWLMLAPVVITLCMVALAVRLQSLHKAASEMRENNDVRRMSFLREVLQNARIVKLLGVEQQMLRRYEMLQAGSSKANQTLISVSDLGFSTSSIAAQVATISTCGFGAVLVINQQFGIAELAGCMLLTGRAVQPVMQLIFLSTARNDAVRRTNRIVEIFKAPVEKRQPRSCEIQDGALEFLDAAKRKSFGDGFHFQSVSISIPAKSLTVVKGTIEAHPFQLLRLIAGEVRADEGQVLVDGCAASELTASRGAGGIWLEGRTPVILEGTLLENLVSFKGRLPSEDVLAVAEAIGLDTLIAQLPLGINTELTGSGRDISSPGLVRRVALARAIAARPRVLLLDQPFADLDPDGIARMEDILDRISAEMTCVVTGPTARLERLAHNVITLRPNQNADVAKREKSIGDGAETAASQAVRALKTRERPQSLASKHSVQRPATPATSSHFRHPSPKGTPKT